MTKNLVIQSRDNQFRLLDCCRYVANHSALSNFAKQLSQLFSEANPINKKDLFDQIITSARSTGLKTEIVRLIPEHFHHLRGQLPLIAELKDGQFVVLAAISQNNEFKLLYPEDNNTFRDSTISFDIFQQISTGSGIRFTQINTALTCFSLVAREHKIELTLERLRHEYSLSTEETDPATLLRMAKEQGLKAKILNLTWRNLFTLKKAYPAIASLKNGKHVVLTGIQTKEIGGEKNILSVILIRYPDSMEVMYS